MVKTHASEFQDADLHFSAQNNAFYEFKMLLAVKFNYIYIYIYRERERERDRQTDRRTDRQTETGDRNKDRDKYRLGQIKRDKETER